MGWKDEYEAYLQGYCDAHGLSKEEAEKHKIVKIAKQSYMEGDKDVQVCGWKEVNT